MFKGHKIKNYKNPLCDDHQSSRLPGDVTAVLPKGLCGDRYGRSQLQSSRSLFTRPKGSGRNIWRRLWEIRELQVEMTMTETIHEHSPPPGFTDKGQPSSLVDEDGVITLTPEEEALLLKIRA
ncbi:hypothetical protein AgCh_000899 [Apium graveolens]